MSELWQLPAARLAALVRGGEVRAGEVLRAHLERIEQVDPLVNALPVRLVERAQAEAAAVDAGRSGGALAGVPIAVKINTAVAGVPTSSGCPGLAGEPASADAWVVGALRRQGAIVVALANAPEFSLRWHTDNPLYGPTANPRAPGRVAGGSSGGSAAAVATGMVPLAQGNDQGGSLRHPASCCGVVAIRPTIGLTPPDGPHTPYGTRLFGVEGVLSRTVADNLLGLGAVLAGRPDGFPAPALPDSAPRGAVGARIAVVTRPAGAVHPEVEAAVRRAAAILADAGAQVVPVDPPGIRDLEQARGTVVYAETRAAWGANRKLGDEGTTLRSLSRMEDYFPAVDLPGYLAALRRLTELTARWHEFAAGFDAVLGPVATEPPFETGMDTGSPERAHQVIDSMRFVTAMSAVGSPVAVVPVSTGGCGPLGVQIVAPHWQERRCADLAGVIEAAVGASGAPVDPVAASGPTASSDPAGPDGLVGV